MFLVSAVRSNDLSEAESNTRFAWKSDLSNASIKEYISQIYILYTSIKRDTSPRRTILEGILHRQQKVARVLGNNSAGYICHFIEFRVYV